MRGTFSTANYLWTASVPPITAYPFSIGVWFEASSFPVTQYIFGFMDQGGDVDYAVVYVTTSGGCGAFVRRSTTANPVTTANASTGVLNHLLLVSASATSHSLYLNGTNKGTVTTNVSFPTNLDGIAIGVLKRSSITGGATTCIIGDCAMWAATLNDADALSLYNRVSPFNIKPHLLRNYIPCGGLLVPDSSSSEPDLITGLTLNEVGTVQSSKTQPHIIHWCPSEFVSPTNVITFDVSSDKSVFLFELTPFEFSVVENDFYFDVEANYFETVPTPFEFTSGAISEHLIEFFPSYFNLHPSIFKFVVIRTFEISTTVFEFSSPDIDFTTEIHSYEINIQFFVLFPSLFEFDTPSTNSFAIDASYFQFNPFALEFEVKGIPAVPHIGGKTIIRTVKPGLTAEIEISVPIQTLFGMRVKVFEKNSYTVSANATIEPVAAKSEIIKSHTALKDVEFYSFVKGRLNFNITNAVVEEIDIRIGPTEFNPLVLDYSFIYRYSGKVFTLGTVNYVIAIGDFRLNERMLLTMQSEDLTIKIGNLI